MPTLYRDCPYISPLNIDPIDLMTQEVPAPHPSVKSIHDTRYMLQKRPKKQQGTPNF